MKRITLLLILVAAAVAATFPAHAVEGMWQPRQLPELRDDLAVLGLELDPARLTRLTEHPMNAVINLGGCTASFVSPDGLAVTNHHCSVRAIQYNSSEENNYLEDGFLASDRSAELFAGPGSRVLVTVEVDDVTQDVVGGLSEGSSGIERYEAIDAKRKSLVAECEKDPGHRCSVRSFHGGMEYFLIKALEIRDVRLVYAPARGIGNYGGDVDNWFWPRHTGDYTFFRAYVGKDGKPADHDPGNVPYRPKHYLRVAQDGLAAGDFIMVAGYPAATGRHRLAREMENRFEWYYPKRKRMLERMLEIVEEQTADRPDAAIKYASLVARLNNSIKNYDGMLTGYAGGAILEQKRDQETALRIWAETGGDERMPYAAALQGLNDVVAEDLATRERDLVYGLIGRRSLISAARTLYRLSKEREKPDAERERGFQQRDLRRIRERLARLDRSFDPDIDRALLRQVVLGYAAIPVDQHIAELDAWFGIEGTKLDAAKLDARLDEMYAGTQLGSLDERMSWFEATPAKIEASDDPFLRLAVQLHPAVMAIEQRDKELSGRLSRQRAKYMEALIAFRAGQGESIYADANSTLRVTYGTVQGYSPRDGVIYTPFTTLDGVLEKDTGDDPFDSPADLLAAAREKRYGDYRVESLGSVPVNFLSDVDTTGGNSGSPTLNARGELVGLLFDGVWESIISDWFFNPVKTRSIHVDIRYVLWVMSQVDHAEWLLQEMGVTTGPSEPNQ